MNVTSQLEEICHVAQERGFIAQVVYAEDDSYGTWIYHPESFTFSVCFGGNVVSEFYQFGIAGLTFNDFDKALLCFTKYLDMVELALTEG